jgi:cell division protein FtsI/penicillin-binding protein 2
LTARLANRRIRLLIALFGAVFATALFRSAWLQAVQAPSLDRLARGQQRETIVLPARRGTIYDRMGKELAIGEQAITVYANPRHVQSPRAVAPIVAKDLGLDPAEVLGALSDRSKGFVYLERKADPERARALEARHLTGIGFYPEEKRTYPQHKVASSVVGYAGVDNRGLAGVELQYDRTLSGHPGQQTIVHDPSGQILDVVDTVSAKQGHTLTLTIDNRIQAQVEQVLRETRARWGAKGATAIVLDPSTGAILAMADEPGYDANRFGGEPADVVRNRTVTDTYEPGSTFKVVTVAAALEEGLVTPSTAFTLQYQIQVSDRTIHDAEERGTERMTVAQILARSSNVGAITLALNLGPQRLAKWIARFGFGKLTGVDYPGESAGIVLPLDRWTGSTIGNVPIGQGIAVTPIQMAAVYAAIANRGMWIRPHLASRIGDHDPVRPDRHRLVSARVAKQLTWMMRGVVSEGTGVEAQVPGYTVAGKTGTAAKPDAGGYSDTRYVASFVGFVPARHPRLAILVTVDEPHGAIFGGTVAAPAFRDIAAFALQYLGVQPDAPETLPAATG